MISRRALILWIGGLVASSLAVSAIIGGVGTDSGFDWNLAAVAGTAFGTVVLAGFTGALAWTTSGDVQATWQLAELTRQEQQSRVRPSVLIYRRGYSGGGNTGTIDLSIVNAGLGAALDIVIDAKYGGGGTVSDGSVRIPFIRSAGSTDEYKITVNQPSPPTGGVRMEHFTLSGTCTDMGRQTRYDVVDLTA